MSGEPQPHSAPTLRRRVYYLSGFDPRGARFYHRLYQTEAALQQPVNGCRYEVGRRIKAGEHITAWTVKTRCGERDAETRFAFLGWDDLVRDHWPASVLRVMAAMAAFYWSYTLGGGMVKTLRCTPRGFSTLLLPALYALVTALLASVFALGCTWLASRLTHIEWMASLAGLCAAVAVLKLCLVGAERLRLFWLMRILVFVLAWGKTRPDALEQRWMLFAELIQADLAEHSADEVLIVGHSVGAMAAVAVAHHWLARTGAATTAKSRPPPLMLLTLGSAIPLLGMVPEADWFRSQLASLVDANLPWLDYTAPHDPLCHALVNPFDACGLPRPTGSGYRMKSARFDKMFGPADYANLRRDAFRVHFQYLMATKLPVANDFFQLTAGTERLLVTDVAMQPSQPHATAV